MPYHHHNQHHHHGSVGKVSVVTAVAAAKSPGTPRREQSHRLEKAIAVQDPGLRDYVSRGFLHIHFLCRLRLLHSIFCSHFMSLRAGGFVWWTEHARPVPTKSLHGCMPCRRTYAPAIRPLAWRLVLEFFVWITPGLRARDLGGWDRGDMWLATPHFPPWTAAGPICEK